MRKTDEQKKAVLQQRIAVLREKVRRIERHENAQARRDRAHVGIVVGTECHHQRRCGAGAM